MYNVSGQEKLTKKRGVKMEINLEAFKELLEERFDGNQAKMARVLGISKYQLNIVFNNNGKCAGKKIFGSIIKYCDTNELDFHKYIFLQ